MVPLRVGALTAQRANFLRALHLISIATATAAVAIQTLAEFAHEFFTTGAATPFRRLKVSFSSFIIIGRLFFRDGLQAVVANK